MSSGCGDVLSLEDLKTAKKHQIFEAEVITGRAGGVSTGDTIDYATNQATGQVQKTMPAILRDIGYTPASFDFDTGGTIDVNERNVAVLWPLPGGDGDWYYWEGALPKVIPAASTPNTTGGIADGAWRPVGDLTLRNDLLSSGGFKNIGQCESFDVLRALEPTAAYQVVLLRQFESSVPLVGAGQFYYDPLTSLTDDGGTVAVTPTGKRWRRVMPVPGQFHAEWFGVSKFIDDVGPRLKKAADAARKSTLILPQASGASPLKLKSVVQFQTNCGIKLRGHGKDCTTFLVQIPAGNESMGALHFPGTSGSGEGFAGIEISNIQLIGNVSGGFLSKCHGIYLQYQYTSVYRNITIEKFNGAGLLIDKCQDSLFDQVDLFDCGRTSGNRDLLVDGFDTTKTEYSPVHCISTLGSDRSNFLRFNNCQFEDHKISPVIDWQGGINNSFTECHFEYNSSWDITGTDGGSFLRLREGIINFNGGGVAEYRVLRHGSGEVYMDNTRCTPTGVDYTVTGGSSSRCKFTKINIHSFLSNLNTSSFKEFDFCTFTADMLVGFPDNRVTFNSCLFQGNLSSNSTSGGLISATLANCIIQGNLDLGTGSKNWIVTGNTIVGTASFGSQAGYFSSNRVVGSIIQSGVDINHIETNRKLFIGNSPPATGTYAVGDQSRNLTPTAGGYIGWVCVTAGSPGVWKGFGLIQA
jgi:hypothetical protein